MVTRKISKTYYCGLLPITSLNFLLTLYLDFTQGRTAIQFVQENAKKFIQEEPIEVDGHLNLIYPVALVDAFEGNFSNPDANPEYSTVFSDYSYSANKVKNSTDAEPGELLILKALLLFHTSSGRLAKPDREKHEEILSLLTGMSIAKVKVTLDKLHQTREIIYYNPADNTYRFYGGGFGIDELRKRIKEETGKKSASASVVESYCHSHMARYIGNEIIPTHFIEINSLRSEDWRYQNKIYTITKLKQALSSEQTVKDIDASGIVAYVVAETAEELSRLRSDITQLLERSPINGQIVVAITSQPVGQLAQLLQEYAVSEKKSVQDFGVALNEIKKQYQKQIHDGITDLFKSCNYYCHILDKIPVGNRNNISYICQCGSQ